MIEESMTQSTDVHMDTPSSSGEASASDIEVEREGEDAGDKPSPLDFAKKFNELTASEKRLREKEESFKKERDEIMSLKEEISKLKENPLQALEAAGWSFKDLAEMILNDEKPTTEQRIESLEERILSEKKEREEREQAQKTAEEEKIKQFEEQRAKEAIEKAHRDIKELVDGSDEYEMIQAEGAYDLVWEVIEEAYNATEKVLPFAEAAQKVEEYLTQEAEKVFSVGKFKKKYQPIPEPEEKVDIGHNYYYQKMLEEKYGRSLTNDMQSDSAAPSHREKPFLSDEESKAVLAKKLKDMLAKQS